MITINESFHKSTQVLVVGGGPSGLAAAISAARCGVKVLLAEATGCLGGMATSGLVGPFMTSYDSAGEKQIIKGFFNELITRLEQEGGAINPSKCKNYSSYAAYRTGGHSNVGPFNSDVLKRVAEQMCIENNVELLYNASLIDIICENNVIKGGIFAVRGGSGIIDAEMVIDCTGNGDAAYLGGVPMEKPEDVQPASLFFNIDGVDKQAFEDYKAANPIQEGKPNAMLFEALIKKLQDEGSYPVDKGNIALYESCDNTWRVNMSRINGVDATDPFDATRAAVELRKQIPIIVNMLKTYIPSCKNIRVTNTADQAGFRESRRIIGDFVLTAEDMSNSVVFEDNIALCANSFDMHVGKTVKYILAPEKPYGIPYRSLIPKKIKNLLVAGRCISCTRDALAAIRVMPPCFAMGQAAGAAAAIALNDSCQPKDVNINKLQKELRSHGAVLTYDDI